MKNLFAKFNRPWIVIAFALIFSLLVVSPHFIAFVRSGGDLGGIYPAFSDDEVYYQARIAEVTRGRLAIGNAYIKEHEADPFLQPPVAEWLVAGIVWTTGLAVPAVTILGDIIFPFIGFLLLYLLFWRLMRVRYLALVYSSVFFLLFIQTFGRPISPQITSLFMFVGLYLIYLIYPKRKNLPSNSSALHFLLGLDIGALLFISPYYWTALAVLYFLLIAGKAWFEKTYVPTLKKVGWFLLAFLPCALLYGFYFHRASTLPGYIDSAERFGLISSHLPGSFTNIFLGILFAILVWLARKILSKENLILVISLVVSIFILNWQNVITGRSLQFSSHYLLVTILYGILIMSVVYRSWLDLKKEEREKTGKKIGLALITLLLILGYRQQGEFRGFWSKWLYRPNQVTMAFLKQQTSVFAWLNKNTSADSVIYTLGSDYSFLLPVYTHNKAYYNFYATLFVMPNRETEDRWLINNIFNSQLDKKYLTENQRDFWGNRFLDSYHSRENRRKILAFITNQPYWPATQIDPQNIAQLLRRYNDFKREDFSRVLKTYQIDYILLSKRYPNYDQTKKMFNESNYAKLVVDLDGELIYQVQ